MSMTSRAAWRLAAASGGMVVFLHVYVRVCGEMFRLVVGLFFFF
jgi:hypothetical protein